MKNFLGNLRGKISVSIRGIPGIKNVKSGGNQDFHRKRGRFQSGKN